MSVTIEKLSLPDFEKALNEGALIIDVRAAAAFCEGFIPGSIYMSNEFFSEKIAAGLITPDQEIILVCDMGSEDEVMARLEKEGFGSHVEGYLDGSFESWQSAGHAVDVVISVTAEEVILDMRFGNPQLADIRSKSFYRQSHLPETDLVDAQKLMANAAELPKDSIWYLYDRDGEYALTVISYLKKAGLHNYYHIQGGYKSLLEAEAEMVSEEKKPKKKKED